MIIWEKTKLFKGAKLLDVGCGFGDWLNYAKQRGAIVTGVNISPEQSEIVRKRGIDIINLDFMEYKNGKFDEFKNNFDVITFMDSIEHYCPPTYRYFPDKYNKVYQNVFEFADLLINPKLSKNKYVFISFLHQVKNLDLLRLISLWILDRTMCGFYPINEDGLTKNLNYLILKLYYRKIKLRIID